MFLTKRRANWLEYQFNQFDTNSYLKFRRYKQFQNTNVFQPKSTPCISKLVELSFWPIGVANSTKLDELVSSTQWSYVSTELTLVELKLVEINQPKQPSLQLTRKILDWDDSTNFNRGSTKLVEIGSQPKCFSRNVEQIGWNINSTWASICAPNVTIST